MALLASLGAASYARFVAVALIFVLVLLLTSWSVRLMASVQKQGGRARNLELVESLPLAPGRHIHLVRLGGRYVALASSREGLTMLAEVEAQGLILGEEKSGEGGFAAILSKVRLPKQGNGKQDEE